MSNWDCILLDRCGLAGRDIPLHLYGALGRPACDELTSLPPDLIQRGPELGPSFVNLKELPPRFARPGRDQEPAAQAGHLRMIAKPTYRLLVCLAAIRAANRDLGTIQRAFGHDASLQLGLECSAAIWSLWQSKRYDKSVCGA
jgi:hypothetical protein